MRMQQIEVVVKGLDKKYDPAKENGIVQILNHGGSKKGFGVRARKRVWTAEDVEGKVTDLTTDDLLKRLNYAEDLFARRDARDDAATRYGLKTQSLKSLQDAARRLIVKMITDGRFEEAQSLGRDMALAEEKMTKDLFAKWLTEMVENADI